MSKRTVVPMLKDLLEEFDGDRIQLVIGSSRHLLNLRTMEAKELPPKQLLEFPVRNPQDGLDNSATESDVCPDRNEREGEPHHMQRFLITSENQMVTINSTAETPERGTAFDSEQQLAEVTSDWPASRLVEIWNALPGVTAIRKFKDRATALSRIWKQAQSLPPFVEPAPVEEVPAQTEEAKLEEAKSESGGSKKDLVVSMLDAAEGVTLAQIMAATGWQKHSVRGFLSGAVGKKMGLAVVSSKPKDGERVYRIQR